MIIKKKYRHDFNGQNKNYSQKSKKMHSNNICFHQEDMFDFEQKYQSYMLYSFVQAGLTDKKRLTEIHKENKECIEALSHLPVVVAVLGDNQGDHYSQPKITIEELNSLGKQEINIIKECRHSYEVVQIVKNFKSNL
jgi:hypothetical protein